MKWCGLLVVALVACGSKKSGDSAPKVGAKPISAGTTCPIPKAQGITDRFAVGTVPDYRVADMRSDHGMLCHDDFPESNVIKMQNGKPMIVAEGTFQGGCKESPGPRIYDAVKAAKVGIEVNALATDQGKLGMNEAVFVDSKTPDKMAGVYAHLVDRCGDPLTVASAPGPVTWTAGAGCDKVAKVQKFDPSGGIETGGTQMQVAAIGPGTCTYTAEWAGAKGDVSITVK